MQQTTWVSTWSQSQLGQILCDLLKASYERLSIFDSKCSLNVWWIFYRFDHNSQQLLLSWPPSSPWQHQNHNSARRTQPIELSYYSEASHLARAELSAFWNRRHDATWRDEPTSSANMILLSYATSITAHARWTRFNLFTFRPVRCFQHFTHLSRIIITTSGILRRKWGLKRERN